MRRTKNGVSVWIMVWGIDQSGERQRHHEGGSSSHSGSSEGVLVGSFAGAGTAGAGAAGAGTADGTAAFFEGSACNSSS